MTVLSSLICSFVSVVLCLFCYKTGDVTIVLLHVLRTYYLIIISRDSYGCARHVFLVCHCQSDLS